MHIIGELTKNRWTGDFKETCREMGTQPRKSRKKRKTKKEKKREEEDVLNVTEEMIAETQSRIEEIEGRITINVRRFPHTLVRARTD